MYIVGGIEIDLSGLKGERHPGNITVLNKIFL